MGQQNAIEQGFYQGVEDSVKPITSVWQAFEDLNFDAKCGGGGRVLGGDISKCVPAVRGGIADVNDLGRLGFLTPDLTGFDQEAIDHSEGFAGFWHDVKSFFGSKESCEDKLNEHVMKNLSPKEKDAYKAEEKQLDEYNRKWISWATQATINPGPPPEMPDLPMHNEVKERVKEMEKKITEQIRSEMSPQDRARLDSQMKKYAEDYAESTRIHNPMGTGEGFKPRPKPPALVQDYYERVKEAVDKATR
jgi:hypothetical protein